MTERDRQLWKFIRDKMARAEWNSASDNLVVLPHAEFTLLYGQVNALCHADVHAREGAVLDIGDEFVINIGQEPDEQVLRHADTVESWNELKSAESWTAEEIRKREG